MANKIPNEPHKAVLRTAVGAGWLQDFAQQLNLRHARMQR